MKVVPAKPATTSTFQIQEDEAHKNPHMPAIMATGILIQPDLF